ncbi:MAG: hypothetical protein HC935_01305 [Pseudanabaena sp. SU_2_4]|nr:hypothetical protein [Pseudanabaena sp. SU_2_4]
MVSVLLLFGLFSTIKTTFKTAFLIALVVFGLQVFTGIGPEQIFSKYLSFLVVLATGSVDGAEVINPLPILEISSHC